MTQPTKTQLKTARTRIDNIAAQLRGETQPAAARALKRELLAAELAMHALCNGGAL